jgi:DNA-binding SARP family transcriptional activator
LLRWRFGYALAGRREGRGVELRLLGPVEIRAGEAALAMGVPQRRVVLAALAVDVGRVVVRQTLIDRV